MERQGVIVSFIIDDGTHCLTCLVPKREKEKEIVAGYEKVLHPSGKMDF
jgi:hypothetical protein